MSGLLLRIADVLHGSKSCIASKESHLEVHARHPFPRLGLFSEICTLFIFFRSQKLNIRRYLKTQLQSSVEAWTIMSSRHIHFLTLTYSAKKHVMIIRNMYSQTKSSEDLKTQREIFD